MEKYRNTAIALHWLIAIAIFAQITLGLYMSDLPRGTDARSFYFNLHKSIGLTIALFIAWRLLYRLSHLAPALPRSMPQWEQLAAKASHFLLYVCMIVMPVSGYIGSSFSKYGVKFWGIELPNWGWESKELREVFVEIHEVTFIIFGVLIGLHILAAIKHVLVDHDNVFQRMLP